MVRWVLHVLMTIILGHSDWSDLYLCDAFYLALLLHNSRDRGRLG